MKELIIFVLLAIVANASVRKAERSISNDDVKGGGNSGENSGSSE